MNGMDSADHFLYFAYASNLKTSVLEDKIGSTINAHTQGRLSDYGFRFNKKNDDESAHANIIHSESEDVFGVVYQIDERFRQVLARTETGYELEKVIVETASGNVEVLAFISICDDEDIHPLKEYLSTILQGAKEHKLPDEYTDFITSLARK